MRVKKYTEENGYVNIVLANEEEQLCFINPNIYNGGKWKLNSYIKKVFDKTKESFEIVIAHYGNKENNSYIITYTSDECLRMINSKCNDIVDGEVIVFTNNDSRYYYSNKDDSGININQYIREKRDYYDVNKNVFSGDLNKSTLAIINCLEYIKKYSEILCSMESQLKIDLGKTNILTK